MLFHFNVCLEDRDNIYFCCPFDFKVNTNWPKIIEIAKNNEGRILDENAIIFPSIKCIESFMFWFAHFYAGIQMESKSLETSKKSN